MKKLYILTCVLPFLMLGIKTNATTINVSVTNNVFTPATFNAIIGDMIVWTWNSTGIDHNVTSASIPVGATSFASGNMSGGTFSYTISTAGNYAYSCTLHPGMAGGFSVSAIGISEPSADLLTTIYPNPFKEKITVKYTGIESVDVFNILGDKVKTIELSATENKVEIDFANLPSGIYFYRTSREGTVIETKKIVKTN